MGAPSFRHVGIIVAAVLLGSCSYSYRVRAVVIDGRLAFVVDPSSDREPKCINGIHVSTDKGEVVRAKATPGDDEQLVANGVFWWRSLEADCENPFPIFYGQPLKGERLVYGEGIPGAHAGEASSQVEAKPLHIGVVYEVSTTSGANGYGGGYFRITRDRRVENWSEDPTPAVLNEQGYDISSEYVPPPSPTADSQQKGSR